jgi:hypothetical protein
MLPLVRIVGAFLGALALERLYEALVDGRSPEQLSASEAAARQLASLGSPEVIGLQ